MRNQPLKDPKIVSLIHHVRSEPQLYDFRIPANSDGHCFSLDQIWEKIAASCGMANAAEAKMYWKNLHYSFTVFYRNELIRLVRANYNEKDIGPIPEEIISPKQELFGNRPWCYYSDMRFIAPFRVKGIDPELDRLIELAKPIVRSEENKGKFATQTQIVNEASCSSSSMEVTEARKEETAVRLPSSKDMQHDSILGMDVPDIHNEDLSLDDACLRSFFDALYRSTRSLPRALQRRVKQEMLVTLNNAEADAEVFHT